jgi:hypothetical protein
MGSLRSQLACLGASAVALIIAAPALAETPPPPPPPGTPSIDQYVETVPTSSGGAAPGVGKPHVKPLSHRVNARLQARHDAVTDRLRAVATSSVYGAPQHTLAPVAKPKVVKPNAAQSRAREHLSRSAEPKTANPLSAAVSAVSDSGDGHVFWLLAAVIVVTISMVWAAARRHRSA